MTVTPQSRSIRCLACHVTVRASDSTVFCPRCGARLLSVRLALVTKAFDAGPVLRNVDLSVSPGESVAVVGRSGAGKSVLLQQINGSQSPDSGRVLINGFDIPAPSNGGRSHCTVSPAYVFQGSALIDSLTVAENVALPLTAPHFAGRSGALQQRHQLVRSWLHRVGIPASHANLMPEQLSGGMQKRVAIARALIGDSEIVLYDEPTTGLDVISSERISRLMNDVRTVHAGLTSITVTHDYLSAGLTADRVLFLDSRTGQLATMLTAQTIRDVREQCPEDELAAANQIRDLIEARFREHDRMVNHSEPAVPPAPGVTWRDALSEVLVSGFQTCGAAFLLLGTIGMPPRMKDVVRRLYDIAFRSLPVVMATGFFVGMMLAMQIASGLQNASAPMDPIPAIVGSAIIDTVGPLILGLLMAGRIGASICAEIGGRRLARQLDALCTMSLSPEQFWLNPIFWAAIVSLPLLAIALELAAIVGAWVVAVGGYGVNGAHFSYTVLKDVSTVKFVYGLFRAAVFGAAIALLAYSKGAEDKRSTEAVGQSTTDAVVAASLAVIFLDFLMSCIAKTWST